MQNTAFFIDSSYGKWEANTGIKTGLTTTMPYLPGAKISIGGNDYFLMIKSNGAVDAFKWNGTDWDDDTDGIASGLSGLYDYINLVCFYIGTDLYLLAGNSSGAWLGFIWNSGTTQWDSDTDIITGLPNTTFDIRPTAFYINTDLYMIVGNNNGTYTGYKWNSSTTQWDSNTGIVNGLIDDGPYVNNITTPTVFYIGTELYLLSGDFSGSCIGYKYTGSGWLKNGLIINNLSDIGYYNSPLAFYIDTDLYMIQKNSDGTFYGYKWS